jgi:hypothetical protein
VCNVLVEVVVVEVVVMREILRIIIEWQCSGMGLMTKLMMKREEKKRGKDYGLWMERVLVDMDMDR